MVACGAMITWVAWNLSKLMVKRNAVVLITSQVPRTREGFSRIAQDSRSDIHVNKLDGHINVIYDMSDSTGLNFAKQGSKKNGLDPADIEGGNFIVKSAAAGSGVHGYVTGDHLDTSSESNVNKILDNLAHKFYYENYVKGERNLSGTVSIASKGIVSSYKKR